MTLVLIGQLFGPGSLLQEQKNCKNGQVSKFFHQKNNVCMYVCMYDCIYICIVYLYMYSMYVCMYVYSI